MNFDDSHRVLRDRLPNAATLATPYSHLSEVSQITRVVCLGSPHNFERSVECRLRGCDARVEAESNGLIRYFVRLRTVPESSSSNFGYLVASVDALREGGSVDAIVHGDFSNT